MQHKCVIFNGLYKFCQFVTLKNTKSVKTSTEESYQAKVQKELIIAIFISWFLYIKHY